MKIIEKSGNSIIELISQFRSENGLKEWEVEYDVVSKASSGVFGLFGKKAAKVNFKLHEPKERVELFVRQLLEQLDLDYDNMQVKAEGKSFYVTIYKCNDPGFLIGKNGSMLETLQYYINRVFENSNTIDKVYLDSEGYRARREDQYLRQFSSLINKVKSSGKTLTLEPMGASERRIIHKYVERDRGLKTLTVGEGEKKRIVIFSAKLSDKEALSGASDKAEEPKVKPDAAKAKTQIPKPKAQAPKAKTEVPKKDEDKAKTPRPNPRPRQPRPRIEKEEHPMPIRQQADKPEHPMPIRQKAEKAEHPMPNRSPRPRNR